MLSEREAAWSVSVNSLDLSEFFDCLHELDPSKDHRTEFVARSQEKPVEIDPEILNRFVYQNTLQEISGIKWEDMTYDLEIPNEEFASVLDTSKYKEKSVVTKLLGKLGLNKS